ncbi:MAG: metal-dependent hydrolase [Bdellovibrionales bacterium]|nr:metal-dependent hydrolase [Bdellovibrionales bacterium]
MDNITHSLIGGAVAELALGRLPEERRKALRPVFWSASVLASNAPDIDIIIPRILNQGQIDYLLHHRGHTHTWLLSVLLSLLCWLLVRPWTRSWEQREKVLFAGLALFAGLLHVFADGWNIYGVHPLWPFHNGWYFGDAVFILEPLLWLLLAPALAFTMAGRARWILLGPLALLLVLAWNTSLLPLTLKVGLTLGVAAAPLWRRWPRRVAVAAAGATLVVAGFHALSLHVRARFHSLTPGQAWKEVALTPFPAHPLCWNVFGVRVVGGEYRAVIGTVSAGLVRADSCPPLRHVTPTAPLRAPLDLPSENGAVAWFGEFRAPVEELRSLARESCWARAALRFHRVPVWSKSGDRVILGDLRFDREPGLGFSEIVIPENGCPEGVPSWTPPTRGWMGE